MRQRITEQASRWTDWWHKYAGSVAFVSLVLVTAAGFYAQDRALKRLVAVEVGLAEQSAARITYEVNQRLAYEAAKAEQERVVADQQRVAAEIVAQQHRTQEELRLAILRDAYQADCRRLNMLRARLRDYMTVQQRITTANYRSLRSIPVMEYVEVMNEYETTLETLFRSLQPSDCSKGDVEHGAAEK